MGDLIHRNNASKDKIIASNVLMGQGNNKTDTVEKRIRDLEESGGGGGSDVEVTPLLHEGVHIADIKVNGEKSELYAPEGGGTGTITDVEVNGVSVVTEGVANIDLSGKQNVLTAGTNVSIIGDVISATDTTYNDMVGATSEADGVHGLMPAPTSSDLDKAVRGDGTWGYAGAIDDVHVNGQSVVENKIASFNNYVELTQVEYDALPNSKYSDGILYCIKNSGIDAQDRFCPVIYSTNERIIGVGTDNKPLYQKTFNIDWIPNQGQGTTVIIDSNLTKDLIKSYYLDGTWCVGNWAYPGAQQINLKDTCYFDSRYSNPPIFRITETGLIMTIQASGYGQHVCLTVQYTKNADRAGSGMWGTDGIPMEHYNTSETVIGTWVDGKTLYRKCYKDINTGTAYVDKDLCNNLGIAVCTKAYCISWASNLFKNIQMGYNHVTKKISFMESSDYITTIVIEYTKN